MWVSYQQPWSSTCCCLWQLTLARMVLLELMYTFDIVVHENPSVCTTSKIEWPIYQTPRIWPRSNAFRSVLLPILLLTITGTMSCTLSCQTAAAFASHYRACTQLKICIMPAIPNSIALQYIFVQNYIKYCI